MLYAHRCKYIFFMRKPFEAKILRVQETIDDVSDTSRRIGNAAESQATLNIALTAVCVAALLVAMIVARGARGGAS
ncbi:hypothetical protein AQI94_41900 [Streptomyces pseudovenezuelae]|uniref:Uncharacterized protein n=1 Tax=Streptomyces pseudovenezuelae TaxID=67350 RepID=A0A124H8D3_9ACTN|nr:hypothetical protein AQI94_41900 [Streptomyces pseudovenezuelae]